ncbi:MAG: protein rep [Rhizobiales bacterium]|nr:protein rep [Hyphomicrobiales bacterium]
MHIHALLIVPAKYFRRENKLYIDQEKWALLWQKRRRLDYKPVVDVRMTRANRATSAASSARKSTSGGSAALTRITSWSAARSTNRKGGSPCRHSISSGRSARFRFLRDLKADARGARRPRPNP